MIIGLTGGIGSGKSTVAKLFEVLGCLVFNSDQIAKEIYFDPAVKPKIINLLGPDAYFSETKINKTYISSKIFSDTNVLHQLNSIIHPAVIAKFNQFKIENPGKVLVKETALLFEAHLENEVDKIIMVASPDELRIKRVMERDGLTKEEVQHKIKSQLPQEEKIKKSDFVIYNNEEEFLTTQILTIFDSIKKMN
jgi:dephospho-CoA kinase